MRLFVVPLAALLFIAFSAPSYAQSESTTAVPAVQRATAGAGAGAGAEPSGVIESYVYEVGRAITLNCTTDDAEDLTYIWQKNNTAVDTLEELKDRVELLEKGGVLRVRARTNEEDYGEYSCVVGGRAVRTWHVTGRPVAKLPANVNVVEGQPLKLVCKVIGKPYPPVEWRYAAGDENATALSAGGRATFGDSPAGVPGGLLELKEATRADAGTYSCVPQAAGALQAHTVLRVKGMYDALWPFLGICLEVFLLCAIILVYEKRRTKTEHEDSDTDNHDQ